MSSTVVRKGALELMKGFDASNTTVGEAFYNLEVEVETYRKELGYIPVANTTSWKDWALDNAIPMTISVSFGMLGGGLIGKMLQPIAINKAVTTALTQAAVEHKELTDLAVTIALEKAAVDNQVITDLAVNAALANAAEQALAKQVDSSTDTIGLFVPAKTPAKVSFVSQLEAQSSDSGGDIFYEDHIHNDRLVPTYQSPGGAEILSPMVRMYKKTVAIPGSAMKAKKMAEEIKSGTTHVVSEEAMLDGINNFVQMKFVDRDYDTEVAKVFKSGLNDMLKIEWPKGASTAETFSALSYIYSDKDTLSSHQTVEKEWQFKEIFEEFKGKRTPSDEDYINVADDLKITGIALGVIKEMMGYSRPQHESAYLSYLLAVITIAFTLQGVDAISLNETMANDLDYDDLEDEYETEYSTEVTLVSSEPSFIDGLVARAPIYGDVAAIATMNGAISTGVALVIPSPYSAVVNIVTHKAVSNTWASTLQENYDAVVNMDSGQILELAVSLTWSCVTTSSLNNALPQTTSYAFAFGKSAVLTTVANIAFAQGKQIICAAEQFLDKAVEQATYLEEALVELYDHATCSVDY